MDCRNCGLKHQCRRSTDPADTRKGHRRQVVLTWISGRTATYWMKNRVDSIKGKAIYVNRMSIV
ncbi:transposase [Microbulbifer sp. ZKSA002]|uniref:transposase n=1 Tax=Microbulbifer sp. ZKSA002 TaxID=3243388 RepID=UPI004039448D